MWGSVGGARNTHAKSPGQLIFISDTPGRDFPGGPVPFLLNYDLQRFGKLFLCKEIETLIFFSLPDSPRTENSLSTLYGNIVIRISSLRICSYARTQLEALAI